MTALCGHDYCERTRCAVDPWHGVTRSTCVALAVIAHGSCPQCGAPTIDQWSGQEPLFWWRGAGGVERRQKRVCTGGCGWRLITAHTTTNPRRP